MENGILAKLLSGLFGENALKEISKHCVERVQMAETLSYPPNILYLKTAPKIRVQVLSSVKENILNINEL